MVTNFSKNEQEMSFGLNRDGVDEYERLEGIDTEFADWHAKYTLYKVKEINEGLL